jgi:hypothetical protein
MDSGFGARGWITTREEWLVHLLDDLRPLFSAEGLELPPKIRLTCGFPSVGGLIGRKNVRVGECWQAEASGDEHFEVFVNPIVAHPFEVARIVVHELVHTLYPGHKRDFASAARKMRLGGKPTATVRTEEFDALVAPILAELGRYPHETLRAISAPSKKQGTRLLKAECLSDVRVCDCGDDGDEGVESCPVHGDSGDDSDGVCGYVVRVTSMWVDALGAPHCPVHGAMAVQYPDTSEGE